MNKKQIVTQVKEYIKKDFKSEPTGHDWWHSWRVWKMAKKIAKREGGDLFIIELAALLHDIADWKFYNGDTKAGSKKAKTLLKNLGVDDKTIKYICHIIDNISFKGAGVKNKIKTREGKIVQDAHRLDVIGAIGIAAELLLTAVIKEEKYTIQRLNQNCTNLLRLIKTQKPLQ